jgi:hypothetical protein
VRPLTVNAVLARRRPFPSLARACHEGRLKGGLSVSLRATPDEAVGPLTHALGPAGREVKVLDVRTGTPPVLVIAWRELNEKWEVEDVAGLAHNLNDLLRETDAHAIAVLGDCEDMLQLWCVPKAGLGQLLDARLLDDARNVRTLWALREGSAPTRDEG